MSLVSLNTPEGLLPTVPGKLLIMLQATTCHLLCEVSPGLSLLPGGWGTQSFLHRAILDPGSCHSLIPLRGDYLSACLSPLHSCESPEGRDCLPPSSCARPEQQLNKHLLTENLPSESSVQLKTKLSNHICKSKAAHHGGSTLSQTYLLQEVFGLEGCFAVPLSTWAPCASLPRRWIPGLPACFPFVH